VEVHRAGCTCPDKGVDWVRAWVQRLDVGIEEDNNCMDCDSWMNTRSDDHLWEGCEAGGPGGGSCGEEEEEDMGSCSVGLVLGCEPHTCVAEAGLGGSRWMVLGHCARVCMVNVGLSFLTGLINK
jgi:hypothetical protein